MIKRLYLILYLLLLLGLPSIGYSKTAIIGASSLTGGGTGALDAVECDDIIGDNSYRAIADGDIAIVVTSSNYYMYSYDATGSNSENSPSIIVPNDRASDCSGLGQWELVYDNNSHSPVSLASGVNTLTLSTQEIDTDATVEQLADITPTNDAILGFNGSGNLENKTSLTVDVDLGTQESTTAGRLGRTSGDLLTMGNNAGSGTLYFNPNTGGSYTGAHAFGSATFRLPTGNADPSAAAGWIRHDNVVSNHANGAVRWHDGSNIRQLVDLVAATAEGCTDDQVVAYDAVANLFYCKDDSTGSGSLGSNLTSSTNDITTDNSVIQLVGNSEDIDIEFGTNSIDITTDTGVTEIDFIGIALKDDGVAILTAAANTIDSGQYVDGSIDPEHLATNAVYTATAAKSSGYTIGTDDPKEAYGGVIYVTSAATMQLPAVAAGMSVTVITIGAIAVTVDVNAADTPYLDGVSLSQGDSMDNTSTTGDMLVCTYAAANTWYCASGSPDGDHWTDGN